MYVLREGRLKLANEVVAMCRDLDVDIDFDLRDKQVGAGAGGQSRPRVA